MRQFGLLPLIALGEDSIRQFKPYKRNAESLSLEECLSGRSMPRNRELMRVFRDMELVEHLGSGMRRILNAYDSSIVLISEHFFELRFPMETEALALIAQVTPEVTAQVTGEVTGEVKRLLRVVAGEMSRQQIQSALGLKAEEHFRTAYLKPALAMGVIEMTIPDKPNSRLQKYRLTAIGRKVSKSTGGEKYE